MPRHGFGIHSPFVYDLYTQVIEPDVKEPVFSKIEAYRHELKGKKQPLELADGLVTTLGKIATKAATPPHLGRLLYRISHHFQFKNTLELGTSLGISTLYLAAGDTNRPLFTIDKEKKLVDFAAEQFKLMEYSNIHPTVEDFDTELPRLLFRLKKVGLVYIDGCQQGRALKRYVAMIQHNTDSDTVIIVDNIRHNDEIWQAWEYLRQNPRVALSFDMFRCGILMYRQGIAKQHFDLRFGFY